MKLRDISTKKLLKSAMRGTGQQDNAWQNPQWLPAAKLSLLIQSANMYITALILLICKCTSSSLYRTEVSLKYWLCFIPLVLISHEVSCTWLLPELEKGKAARCDAEHIVLMIHA